MPRGCLLIHLSSDSMKRRIASLFPLIVFCVRAATWRADNGNGTFSNPLFDDEFSDPELIRVGGSLAIFASNILRDP